MGDDGMGSEWHRAQAKPSESGQGRMEWKPSDLLQGLLVVRGFMADIYTIKKHRPVSLFFFFFKQG